MKPQTKYTLADMRRLARSRGGRCLSLKYTNMRARLTWRCGKGHVWDASPSNVMYHGSWCPTCGIASSAKNRIGHRCWNNEKRQARLELLQGLAKAKGGVCLDQEYVDSTQTYRFRCAKRHEWDARPVTIMSGSWCARCASDATMRSLADIQAAAAVKGGRCVSRRYLGVDKKLRFECAQGHRWDTQPGRVFTGSWCPQCHFDGRRGTLVDMKAIARSRGGQCLSTQYVTARTRMLWECHRGHRWHATPDTIKNAESWCRQCYFLELHESAEHKPKRRRRRI